MYSNYCLSFFKNGTWSFFNKISIFQVIWEFFRAVAFISLQSLVKSSLKFGAFEFNTISAPYYSFKRVICSSLLTMLIRGVLFCLQILISILPS